MEQDRIANFLKKEFKKYKEITSAYLYGSVLTKNFSSQSDIDVLFILEDTITPNEILEAIKNSRSCCDQLRLDINVVFYDEFLRRWHIYRPPSYFIGIKKQHKLLWGKDLFREVSDELEPLDVYKRIIDLAQGSRAIYLNDKSVDFWSKKYIKWLRVSVLEVLYLYGSFDLNFTSGSAKLLKKKPELEVINSLKADTLSIQEINKISETLRVFIYKNFIAT